MLIWALKKLDLTSGFRDVFAKQKFGWSLQGGISKSLLYVFSARKKAEGSVIFKGVLSNERMRYVQNKN